MGFSVVIPTSASLNASVEGEAVLAAITGANATLTAVVGVPGPQGPAGSQGPQGQQGEPGPAGVGVPVGGTAGQVLAKVDGVDYNTEWINVDVSAKRDLTDYDFTNVTDTKLDTFGLTIQPFSTDFGLFNSNLDVSGINFAIDESVGGTLDGPQSYSGLAAGALGCGTRTWTSGTPDAGSQAYLSTTSLSFRNYSGSSSGFMQYGNTSITFPNSSVQTIAFPGFNNAALTGNPTAPTAALGDNDTSIATTAFVQQELLSGTANAKNLEVYVRNQTGSTLAAGTIVYVNGATGNRPTVTPAQANNDANSAQTMGFVKTSIANNGFGYVIVRGELENIDTSALTEGVQLYLSPTTPGAWTTTKPSAPQHLVYVGIVIRSHPTQGVILVAVQNGYELNELHDVALASEANNDLLVYESSTDLWKNKSFSTLGLATQSYVTSQGYITSSALTGYATESWVTSQGYLTSAPVTSVAGKTGAVTLAVADVSGAAPTDSPTFTGTPSLPTGTTAVTQAAGNNTTAVATTAFVTSAVPALATASDSRQFTNETKAMSPRDVLWSMLSQDFVDIDGAFLNTTNTGTITAANVGLLARQIRPGTAGACSSRMRTFGSSQVDQTNTGSSRAQPSQWINFSLRSIHSGRTRTSGVADPNYTCAFYYGKIEADGVGDLVRRGYGWKMVGGAGSRFLQLQVHNGTTLTSITSSFAVQNGVAFDWDIESDGAGNVTLYVNGSSVATSSAGPTTAVSGTTFIMWQEEVVASAALSSGFLDFVNHRGRYIVINPW